eukprot:GILJ01002149.1.p1 GENE.GILJ01002149.1~~GILJ01002149.1.p1  ORF type:complete len:462 (-),score=44.11 GILJ01002149.1:1749-3134(-)
MACETCHKAKASCVKKEGYDKCQRCEQHSTVCIPHKRARRGSKTVKKQPCEKQQGSKGEEQVNEVSSIPEMSTKRKRDEEAEDTIILKSENQAPSAAVNVHESQRAWVFRTQQDLEVVVRALMVSTVPDRIHSQWLKLTRWNLDVDDHGLTAIAVRHNNDSAVKWLFKQGVNIRNQYPNGDLLALAINAANIKMMQLLLSKGEQIKEHHLKRAWERGTPKCRCTCKKDAVETSSKCLCRCEENAKHLDAVQETLRFLYDKAQNVTIDNVHYWTCMVEARGSDLRSEAMLEPEILLWHMLNETKFSLRREQSDYIIKSIVEDCSNINTFKKVIDRTLPNKGSDVTHLVKMLVEMSIRHCCQDDNEFVRARRTNLTVEDLTEECVIATKIRFLLDNHNVRLHENNCEIVQRASHTRCKIVEEYLSSKCLFDHGKPNPKGKRRKCEQIEEVPDLVRGGFTASLY